MVPPGREDYWRSLLILRGDHCLTGYDTRERPSSSGDFCISLTICWWRKTPITYQRLAGLTNAPAQAMHGDIVTEVFDDHIKAIGGNKKPVKGVVCPPIPNDPEPNHGCTEKLVDYPSTSGWRRSTTPPAAGWRSSSSAGSAHQPRR